MYLFLYSLFRKEKVVTPRREKLNLFPSQYEATYEATNNALLISHVVISSAKQQNIGTLPACLPAAA